MPNPCENWVSTPGPKRITLESCDEIKLPIMYAYCLKVYLLNQNCLFQMCSIVFVVATNFNVRISPTLCEQYTRYSLVVFTPAENFSEPPAIPLTCALNSAAGYFYPTTELRSPVACIIQAKLNTGKNGQSILPVKSPSFGFPRQTNPLYCSPLSTVMS